MAYVKVTPPSVVYHLTRMENLDSILDDGKISRFLDSECWFCESLGKMKAYMEQTVMCEGKPYYAVAGNSAAILNLCRRTMFFSSSRPAATKIIGTAGIRRSLPAARKSWCRRRRNFQG